LDRHTNPYRRSHLLRNEKEEERFINARVQITYLSNQCRFSLNTQYSLRPWRGGGNAIRITNEHLWIAGNGPIIDLVHCFLYGGKKESTGSKKCKEKRGSNQTTTVREEPTTNKLGMDIIPDRSFDYW